MDARRDFSRSLAEMDDLMRIAPDREPAAKQDRPAGTDWPTNDDHPMAFLGQWNLEELAGSPATSPLPRSGLLSQTPWRLPRENG